MKRNIYAVKWKPRENVLHLLSRLQSKIAKNETSFSRLTNCFADMLSVVNCLAQNCLINAVYTIFCDWIFRHTFAHLRGSSWKVSGISAVLLPICHVKYVSLRYVCKLQHNAASSAVRLHVWQIWNVCCFNRPLCFPSTNVLTANTVHWVSVFASSLTVVNLYIWQQMTPLVYRLNGSIGEEVTRRDGRRP
jgi:hypothetical protein